MRIVISGATGDIGSALARKLGEKHDLILIGRSGSGRLEELRRELGIREEACFLGDMTRPEEVEEFTRRCLKERPVDAFVHAMGRAWFGLLQDMRPEDWNEILGINLTAAYLLTRKILPGMVRRQSGKILYVSSIWGRVGAGMEVAYSAAKGGLDALAKALAKEVAPSGIAVNAVDFGMVDTRMNSHLTEEEIRAIEEEIPVGRQATVEECADFVARVLEIPNYMTGQVIGFDGGW